MNILPILISLLCTCAVHAEFILQIERQFTHGAKVDAYDYENSVEPSSLRRIAQRIITEPLKVLKENTATRSILDDLILHGVILDDFPNFITRIDNESKANPAFMLDECRNEYCHLTRREEGTSYREDFRKNILGYIHHIKNDNLTIVLYASGYLFSETAILLSLLEYRTIQSIIVIDDNCSEFFKFLPENKEHYSPTDFQSDQNLNAKGKREMLKQAYLLRQFLDILQEHNQNQRPELYLYSKAIHVTEDILAQRIPNPHIFLGIDFVYNEQSLHGALEDFKLLGEQMAAGAFFGLLYQYFRPNEPKIDIQTTFMKKQENGPLLGNVVVLNESPTSFSARLLQPLWRTLQWTTSWIWPQ